VLVEQPGALLRGTGCWKFSLGFLDGPFGCFHPVVPPLKLGGIFGSGNGAGDGAGKPAFAASISSVVMMALPIISDSLASRSQLREYCALICSGILITID